MSAALVVSSANDTPVKSVVVLMELSGATIVLRAKASIVGPNPTPISYSTQWTPRIHVSLEIYHQLRGNWIHIKSKDIHLMPIVILYSPVCIGLVVTRKLVVYVY